MGFGRCAIRWKRMARNSAEIAGLATSGRVKPHVQKAYPLRSAVNALASVEEGHSIGKIVMTVG